MKPLRTLATAALLTSIAGCATMHDTTTHGVRSSGNGANSDAAWATLDLNNDSELTWDELEAQRAMGLLQDFPNADANGDRRVSREEWNAWWPRMTDHHTRSAMEDESTPSSAP